MFNLTRDLERSFQKHPFDAFVLLVAVIILSVVSIITVLTLVMLWSKQRKLKQNNVAQKKEIYFLKHDGRNAYLQKFGQLCRIIDEQNKILANITETSVEAAKEKLNENLRFRYRAYYNKTAIQEKKKIHEDANKYAQEILISSIEGMINETVTHRTTTSIKLSNDAIKGKIIGKEGKNKRLFESLTGVDVIIEQQPEITLSCTNPIRRQIAKNVMETLLQLKNIEPNRIESVYAAEKEKFDSYTTQIGKEMLQDKLGIFEFSEQLYSIVGRLYYRYSYGQNVLQHCFEAANIAVLIARELNLDPEKAKRAAFFHDIGKANDFETSFDHVSSGSKIALEFQFPDYVRNAIESHHNNIEPDNVYSAIAKIADEISASRPGARLNNYDEYIRHVEELEEIALSFPTVLKAYGMRSGRILRIMVEPDKVADDQLEALAQEIIEKIESNPLTNLHEVQVIMIKEKRLEFRANFNLKNKK